MVTEFLQATIAGITSGAVFAIAAVGLTLVYGILRLTNFAHGDLLTFGAYAAYVVTVTNELPLVAGLAVAAVATALLCVATEFIVWRPMRRRQAGLLQLLLMSIGLAFVVRYGIQLYFEGTGRSLDVDVYKTYRLGELQISQVRLLVVVSALVVLIATAVLLSRTLLGKSMRALSDNFTLAESSGIDTDRVVLATWALAGGLAGFGGVLAAMDINSFHPNTGFTLLLVLFSAVILGGIGNAYGALIGGFTIGLVQEWSIVFGVDNRYKQVVGFVVLIGVLLVRPQGILGRKRAVN